MFRSWSQTIARPLGVIELQKWLLRITAFFLSFPKKRGDRCYIFALPADRKWLFHGYLNKILSWKIVFKIKPLRVIISISLQLFEEVFLLMYTKHFNLSKNFSKALSPAVMLGDEKS